MGDCCEDGVDLVAVVPKNMSSVIFSGEVSVFSPRVDDPLFVERPLEDTIECAGDVDWIGSSFGAEDVSKVP